MLFVICVCVCVCVRVCVCASLCLCIRLSMLLFPQYLWCALIDFRETFDSSACGTKVNCLVFGVKRSRSRQDRHVILQVSKS